MLCRDAIVINLVSFATSLYAGIAVFAIIGFMANEYNLPVNEVVKSGQYLTWRPFWSDFNRGLFQSESIFSGYLCRWSCVLVPGPALAFVAYPRALSLMPIAPLWTSLFFFMLFLLGIGSQVGRFPAMVLLSAFADSLIFPFVFVFALEFLGFLNLYLW